MVDINAEVIDDVIRKKVEEYHLSDNKKLRRYSYDKELQTLRAVLNWYKENYDVMFVVPVLKRHFLAGVVRKKSNRKKKKMSPEQVLSFFDSFDSVFWKDFAKIHFYMAGRVQEPAGLQWDNVDFDNKLLIVSDVAVWGYSKRFEYLKEVPKNSEERIVHINDEMLEILKRRKKNECLNEDLLRLSDGQPLNFVFHENGEPLNFRQVQYRYNKALKRAGLYPEFSATHILRKAMANIVRQMMGLDAAQAVGGWKSREIVEKVYTDSLPTELNKSAVNNVQGLMKSLEKV
jgi:integrase